LLSLGGLVAVSEDGGPVVRIECPLSRMLPGTQTVGDSGGDHRAREFVFFVGVDDLEIGEDSKMLTVGS
jgi:hypothetical protein